MFKSCLLFFHNWSKWTNCQDGSKRRKCDKCGKIQTEDAPWNPRGMQE